jgi:hypothetical protein
MAEKSWYQFLYEDFVLRDIVGYVIPGSILICGLFIEIDKKELVKYLFTHTPGLIVLIGMSYVTSMGLRLLGTTIYVLTFHRVGGILGRPWATNADRPNRKPWGVVWRGNEKLMRNQYSNFDKKQLPSLISREIVFMHLAGISSMSLLILLFTVIFNKGGGLSRFIGVSDTTIIFVLLIMSVIFLFGHYRHTYQRLILESVKGGGSSKKQRAAQS